MNRGILFLCIYVNFASFHKFVIIFSPQGKESDLDSVGPTVRSAVAREGGGG